MKERKKEMSWSIDISAWSVSLSFCHPIWLKFHDLDYSLQVVLVVERALNVPKLLNTLGLDIFARVIFFKQKSSLNLKMGWHYQSLIFTMSFFSSTGQYLTASWFSCCHHYYFSSCYYIVLLVTNCWLHSSRIPLHLYHKVFTAVLIFPIEQWFKTSRKKERLSLLR